MRSEFDFPQIGQPFRRCCLLVFARVWPPARDACPNIRKKEGNEKRAQNKFRRDESNSYILNESHFISRALLYICLGEECSW